MCFCCIRRFYAFVCVFLWLWPLKIALIQFLMHLEQLICYYVIATDAFYICVLCVVRACVLWCRYCRCATHKSARIKMFDIDFHYI